VRAAVGRAAWCDLKLYDYLSYTLRPLEVARSWHLSVAILACFGGDTSSRAFQVLTQQYILLLDLAGRWDWALYVALFISEPRARGAAVRGLMMRRGSQAQPQALQQLARKQRVQAPQQWWWRCRALRCEQQSDWVGAVGCWLSCGEAQRALVLSLGFLQGPVLVGHAAAPFQRGAGEAVCMFTMSPAAEWLLAVLEESEQSVERGEAPRCAGAATEALEFMRTWSEAPTTKYEAGMIARLYWRCERLRRHVLGVPW